jgi:hypothetical protein
MAGQRECGREAVEQRRVVRFVPGAFPVDVQEARDLAADHHRRHRDGAQLVAHDAARLPQRPILDRVLDRDRPSPPGRQVQHRPRDRHRRVVGAPDQRPRERLAPIPEQHEPALRRQRLLHRRQHSARGRFQIAAAGQLDRQRRRRPQPRALGRRRRRPCRLGRRRARRHDQRRVPEARRRGIGVPVYYEQRIADRDLVTGGQRARRRQPLAVDERAVVAAQVLDFQLAVLDGELAVQARHLAVDQLQVGVRRPPQRRLLLDLQPHPSLGTEQREQDRHGSILNQNETPTCPPTPQLLRLPPARIRSL